MAETPSNEAETVLGLDPRRLLGHVARGRTEVNLRLWTAPPPQEIAGCFPHFEILEMIGRGGMGAVYRASQPGLDRVVALKLLPQEAAVNEAFAQRFRTEARALAKLQHPQIVAIYDSGQTDQGHLYFVMEYVDGHDLAWLLKQGPLPVARALSIARMVCEALDYAHMHGIIHRDIKPANVLLGSNGSVKVADFGLARLVAGPEEEVPHLTMTGSTMGTPAYMSPEQRAGGHVDGRSDLFSLGVMLYEMLTGHLPEGAWQPPSRKSGGGHGLDALVEQLMQRDPARRLRSAAEAGARLERLQDQMRPSGHQRFRPGLAAALVIGAGVAGTAVWWLRSLPQDGASSTSPDAATTATTASQPGATPAGPVLSPPGRLTPLTKLDLSIHSKNGKWHWLDGQQGGTLAIPQSEAGGSPKTVLLPVYPGGRPYELSCEVLLEQLGSSLTVTLPAGRARVALMVDLYDYSGLEFIRGRNWKNNDTSIQARMETGRFLPLSLSILPEGDRVRINAVLDGKPWMQWEGLQADLSIGPDDVMQYLIDRPDPVFALSTITGPVQVRNLIVTIPP